jgi:tetratricopeptide (TPR) repeat protein
MKSIFSFIPKFIFAMVFTVVSTATASTNENDEAARIMEAMELYAQATPMDRLDVRRAELLNQSEAILLDVIENNPASLDAHRKLMGVYLQMRDYPNAIKTMQAAITLSPGDPKLFIALAILYDHQGAYEYAVPVLEQALVLDPENQLAMDYKISIQQKIESQNLAMESSTPPDEMATPHSMDKQSSE